MAKDAKEIKELQLFEGEKILYTIEGNAYTMSNNPIEQLMAGLSKIWMLIMGVKLTIYLVATNKRIVRIDKKTILWGMMTGQIAVYTLNQDTIQSVGYEHVVRWFFLRTSYFLLTNMTSRILIAYKGKREELQKIVGEFSSLIMK